MRKYTNSWVFKTVAIILAMAILGCSTEGTMEMLTNGKVENQPYSMRDQSALKDLTGEEIFKGIYFFEGVVPDLIPSMEAKTAKAFIENLDEDIKDNLEDFKEELITKIYQNNNSFFDDFKKDITSGNQFKVKEALDKSMFEYEKVIMSYSEINNLVQEFEDSNIQYEDFIDSNGEFNTTLYKQTLADLFGDSNNNTEYLFCAAIVAAVVVIIYYGAAIAGAVAVVGGIYLWVAAGQYVAFAQHYTQIFSREQNDLMVEVFIDEISNNLYVKTSE